MRLCDLLAYIDRRSLFCLAKRLVSLNRTVKYSYLSRRILLKLLYRVSYHDNELILGDLGKKCDYLLRGLSVKISRRLVGENYRAVLSESARNYRSLLLTSRELRALVVLEFCKTYALDKLKRSCAPLTRRVDIRERKLNVLKHREAVDYVVFLKDKRYILLAIVLPFGLIVMRGGLALNIKLSLLVGIHTAYHIEKRGLTASRFTCHGNKFANIEIKINAAKSDCHRALRDVYLADVPKLK